MNKRNLSYTALTALFLCIFVSLQAQTKVGIRAAINLSNATLVNENNEKQDTEAIPRLQIGLTVDIPLFREWYLQPGALYTGKGFKQDGGWLAAPGNDFKVLASYIEIPVHLLYKPQFGIGKVFVGAGPYLGYGIGGKWEADGHILIGDIVLSENYGDVIFKNDVIDGEFGNYLYGKPWDYGANLVAGYEFLQQLVVQVHAQFGIANLQSEVGGTMRDGIMRNKGYGISIGYRF